MTAPTPPARCEDVLATENAPDGRTRLMCAACGFIGEWFVPHRNASLRRTPVTLPAEVEALRARVEALDAALHGIANWCEAYPDSVFPQASADAALASCKAAGIPTDAMHGTWARHLLAGIGRDARAALEGKP